MKNTRKGFTLVELLAVIVILAIIMIIAIPAVLSTMEQARQKTFSEYVTKVHNAANNFYLKNKNFDTGIPKGKTVGKCTVYTLAEIGMTSTGDYEGNAAVCVAGASGDELKVLVRLTDKNYHNKSVANAGGWWNFSDAGEVPVSALDSTHKEFADTTETMLTAALNQTRESDLVA